MAYCATSDVEAIFGPANVSATGGWADLSGADDAPTIAARIAYTIAMADAHIDDALRGTGYKLPIQTSAGATPTSVTGMSARLTGVLLYEASGTVDRNSDGRVEHAYGYARAGVEQMLKQIRSGELKLDAITGG